MNIIKKLIFRNKDEKSLTFNYGVDKNSKEYIGTKYDPIVDKINEIINVINKPVETTKGQPKVNKYKLVDQIQSALGTSCAGEFDNDPRDAFNNGISECITYLRKNDYL